MAEPTIKIKRSSVPGKTPSTSNLSLGELGLNTYDGKLFLKQDQGGVGVGTTVITVNPWGVGVGSTGYNVYFTAGNVGIGTTNPTSALQVQGDARISGVVTAVGGFNIGIQSAGVNVVTGVITALNFVGTGNTFNYNSTTKTIDISISGSGVGVAGTVFSRTVRDFTATEGQTTFNVSYTVGYVDVYVNGVYLDASEYIATNGTSVVLNVGANAGDTVSIITYVTGGTLVSGVSDRTKTLVIAGAGQTEFTVDYISDSYLDVYLNGSKLNGNEYTATNGTTVGLTTGASLNDEVEFIAYNPIYSDALWSASNPGYGSTSPIYRVNSNVGIGTTNPTETLQVVGESNIANRTSYRSAPGNLFSFPGTENDIQFPGQNYEIITVGCGTDVAGNLNNTYFTIYGPGGTASAINVTAAEQNVVVWFNVAGAGSTPAVVGAGRSVGIAITSGASAISVGNSITTQMSSDAGFTVATSGDGNVVFVPKTPQNFSNPTVGTAGTVGFAITTTQDGSGILSGADKWIGGVLAPNGKIYGIPYDSTSVLVIDPATNTTSTFGSLSGTDKWTGGVLAPNGKIYGIPRDSTSVLVIDPATNTISTFGSLSGDDKWAGGVLAPNGKIYGIPFDSTSVLSIGGGTAAIPDWYLSAYQNKF